jgi:hypothetical protein
MIRRCVVPCSLTRNEASPLGSELPALSDSRTASCVLVVKTIETHRENIKRKLGLDSGQELVERAIKCVEEKFPPPQKGETAAGKKKKVVPFRAA